MNQRTTAFKLVCVAISLAIIAVLFKFYGATSTIGSNSASKVSSTTVSTTVSHAVVSHYIATLSSNNGNLYDSLTGTQQKVYLQISSIASSGKTGITQIGQYQLSDLAVAYQAYRYDNPQYFWLPTHYLYSYAGNNLSIAFSYKGSIGGINANIDYVFSDAQRPEAVNKINSAIDGAMSLINNNMSQYQKEQILHDWLATHVKYDIAADNNPNANPVDYTAYGALVNKKAVCTGFSLAFKLLMQKAGIDCVIVTGSSQGVSHMWDQVKIDGAWYNVDPTWDVVASQPLHTYFNVTDKLLSADHTPYPDVSTLSAQQLAQQGIQFNIGVQQCKSLLKNYGVMNNTYISTNADFAVEVARAMANAHIDGKSSVEFILGEDTTLVNSTSASGKKVNNILTLIVQDKCIDLANGFLPSSDQLVVQNLAIAGTNGSKGFTLSW